ncbi:MAG: RibD family protein, partial [Phycisphaerales bacterium]|nr:RibD family protein [Phycisphaerae bacterium]NNM25616.1 RibD family protein [Phycisphaerales bacterium]
APAAAFVHRLRTGRPFVTAKWAQTIDGRIATAAGVSNWISSERSRRLVHRARGRVDAILTGIGTVLTDDPQLTARGVRVRRVARRVVIDPQFRTPMDAQLVVTATQTPTTIIGWAGDGGGRGERRVALAAAGVDVIPLGEPGADVPLDTALRLLVERHDVTNVLVEGGAGLVGRLFDADLVNAAWVFVAPRLFADDDAVPCARGRRVVKLAEGIPLRLNGHHVRGGDVLLRYSVASAAAGPS